MAHVSSTAAGTRCPAAWGWFRALYKVSERHENSHRTNPSGDTEGHSQMQKQAEYRSYLHVPYQPPKP